MSEEAALWQVILALQAECEGLRQAGLQQAAEWSTESALHAAREHALRRDMEQLRTLLLQALASTRDALARFDDARPKQEPPAS